MRYFLFIAAALFAMAVTVSAQDAPQPAMATFLNAKGAEVGTATLSDTPHGLLIKAEFTNLPPGGHGFHIHAVGKCEPPFKSAGGHFNPAGKKHGFQNPQGMHAGDLPNIHAGADGKAAVEVLAPQVTLASLFDQDGSALVVHDKADDYKSDPAGESGDRIACAVIKR